MLGRARSSRAALALALAGCQAEGPTGTSGIATGDDCPDTDEDGAPGATEVCNGVDDDCDGVVDGTGLALWTNDEGVTLDLTSVFDVPTEYTMAGPGELILCEGDYPVALLIDGDGVRVASQDPTRPATLHPERGTVIEVTGSAEIADLVLTGATYSGLVIAEGAKATLTSVTIVGNSAGKREGGGIRVESGAEVDATGCIVTANDAEQGGGVYVDDADLTLTDCTISGNAAEYWGGGLYVSDSRVTVTGGTLEGNTSREAGGGAFISDGRVTLESIGISANVADRSGGGVYVSLATLQLIDVVIERNNAQAGGGLLITAGASVDWDGGALHDNQAGNGGGLWAWGLSVNGEGGVASFAAAGVEVSGNVSDESGGALYADGAEVSLSGCAVSGNEAETGGAFFVYQSGLFLESSSVTGNVAADAGGGAMLASDGGFTELESTATDWGTGEGANAPESIGFLSGGSYAPAVGEDFDCDATACEAR